MRELRETPTETGTVLRVAPGRAWVRLARNEACSACTGCAIGAEGKYMIAEAQDSLGVAVEDEIRIRPVKAIGSPKAALLLFGVPILLLFAGYAAGQALARAWGLDSSKEAPGAVGGLLAMALGFVGLYLLSRRRRGGIGIFIVAEIVHQRARPRDEKPLLPAAAR